MNTYLNQGKSYLIPAKLDPYRQRLYTHLVDRKRENLTAEPGRYRGAPCDLFFPDLHDNPYPTLYKPIVERVLEHQQKFPFKLHKFLKHVASSQAACFNLFMPLLADVEAANAVLSELIPDYHRLATEFCDNGFRFEFWDESRNCLGDHNSVSGTDADVGIFYYDRARNLNLWLVEHKLSETEFSICKGTTSKGRTERHCCENTNAVFENPDKCYYHSGKGYQYWAITKQHQNEFADGVFESDASCPFAGGWNQIWRNLLMALEIQRLGYNGTPVKRVHFSVVHHPGNKIIENEATRFVSMLKRPDLVSILSSSRIIEIAGKASIPVLSDWVEWYNQQYLLIPA